jgi:hypothetical protein
VIGHERGDEVVGVVIAGLPAQGERDFGLLTCGRKQFGAELFGEELIGVAIINS